MKRSDLIRMTLPAVSIVGISLLHYLTPLHLPVLHDIFQRLYSIPIIFAAFWFGLRGGVTGFLSQREEERREELRRIADGLEESYRKLQSQADLIIGIEEQLRKAE